MRHAEVLPGSVYLYRGRLVVAVREAMDRRAVRVRRAWVLRAAYGGELPGLHLALGLRPYPVLGLDPRALRR